MLIVLLMVLLAFRVFGDTHLLKNFHKMEIDSCGKITQNAVLKLLLCLGLSQASILAKLVSNRNYTLAAFCLVNAFLTLWFYCLYRKPFLKSQYFQSGMNDDETSDKDDTQLTEFLSTYCHPLANVKLLKEVLAHSFANYLTIPHGKNLL